MRNNRQKIVAISIILLLVVLLGIGFAIFSSRLLINPKVNVDSSHTFNVVFSSSSTELKTDSISPTTYGSATAENAIIDNSITPTIENLSAIFKNPGDKVEYSFYAYDAGEFNAFLKDVKFNNADGAGVFKVCTTEDAVEQSTINDVCDSIKVTVYIPKGNSSFYYISSSDNGSNGGHYGTYDNLTPGTFSNIKITIEYLSNGVPINNPFTVSFGSISLYYTAIQPSTN